MYIAYICWRMQRVGERVVVFLMEPTREPYMCNVESFVQNPNNINYVETVQ